MSATSQISCPLCLCMHTSAYFEDDAREYHLCAECSVVFVPKAFHLQPTDEKAQYDLHQNEVFNPGYRRFLSRLVNPLLPRLAPRARGLDFGCGPGPALAAMFEEQGHPMTVYDPYYFNDDTVLLQSSWDFITATEVVEHFCQPDVEFERLFSMLKSAAYLGIMTKMLKDITRPELFARWHYKNDPTHIIFYSEKSWHYLADKYQASYQRIADDVVIFQMLR